jgi:hypothetical protein
MPLFVRKFIVDTIEGGIAALLALALVIPGTLEQAKAQAAVVGVAVLGAVIAAIRRNLPAALLWLRDKLGVPPS